jgi:hypothetical protein
MKKKSSNKYLSNHVAENATIDDFTENAHRVRRNLILFGIICLFYKLTGATIGKKINIMGVDFTNPNNDFHHFFNFFLIVILIYHFVHFLWLVFEHWIYHIKIRATGDANDNFIPNYPGGTEIPDKRKTNLYKKLSKGGIGALNCLDQNYSENFENKFLKDFELINNLIIKLNNDLNKATPLEQGKKNLQNALATISLKRDCLQYPKHIEQLKLEVINKMELMSNLNNEEISKITTMLTNQFNINTNNSFAQGVDRNVNSIKQFYDKEGSFEDLVSSLNKFDKHWQYYGKSQIWRRFIVEYGIPLFIGLLSILCFTCDYFLRSLVFLISHFLI